MIISAYSEYKEIRHFFTHDGFDYLTKPVSEQDMQDLFSRYLETTFTAYMTKIRMEAATQLLTTSILPVKEIAMVCGYQNYFYFCRVFKDIYSCTPTDYRKAAS